MAYKVGKFEFGTLNEANEAQKEYEAIEHITKQVDFSDLEVVENLYLQLLEQDMFHTEIGNIFMKKLEAQIDKLKEKNRENKPVEDSYKAKSTVRDERTIKKLERQVKKYKTLTNVFRVACIAMLVIIVGMFYVASTINSPNILNYKEKITNEYASWAQELTEKEKSLIEREQNVKAKEDSLKQKEVNN
ncbi:MAG: hypothetical protein K6B67_03130 [Lachnospiraceae bacterium]|nr:hypothetical protein [Lachnospiraceae bacterium]